MKKQSKKKTTRKKKDDRPWGWGRRSLRRIKQCHPDLQKILLELPNRCPIECTVLQGYRNEAAQNKAYDEGHSKLRYPQSKHNKIPSLAFDVAPYPIDWKDIKRFDVMNDVIKEIADEFGIEITQGRNWSFGDHPHTELD